MKTITLVLLSALFSGVLLSPPNHSSKNSKTWALLVAGSYGWKNYRHQADVCHAYQVLHDHGIPDERIVVMMYDDIAYNRYNPVRGNIINRPNGPNVYPGVPRDYTGSQVTPKNFMAILKGDKNAVRGIGSGKVIDSGPDDHVFVYYSDHGAVGILCFPYSTITARELNQTIMYMHDHKKYKEMVLYIEACHSGSMFEDILPNNINVFATTAADASESSWSCYCSDPRRRTCLGDQYSVSWMEDSDKQNLALETLKTQYQIVKRETTRSQVEKFGDDSISMLAVGVFQGLGKSSNSATYRENSNDGDQIRSRDVSLEMLKRQIAQGGTPEEVQTWKRQLEKMIAGRKFLSDKVRAVVDNLASEDPSISELWDKQLKVKNFDCYDEVRNYFDQECFQLSENEYALEFMSVFVNLCEHGVPAEKMKSAMKEVCTHPPTCGID